MIKRISCFLLGILFVGTAKAQFDTAFAKQNIRHCADSLAWGFLHKRWDVFARYTHPALIGSLGGVKEFMDYMSSRLDAIPDSAWKMYSPGKILQVVKSDGDLQSVVELKSIAEFQGKRITTTSHLIGQSWDGGSFWTFFDSEGDRPSALLIKPDLSDKLILPQKKETTEPLNPNPSANQKTKTKTKQNR